MRPGEVVDVTTHLRGRAAQAGALLALVGGMIAATASPALAAGLEAQIDSVQTEVESGKQVQLRYTVRNTDEIDVPGQNNQVRVTVNSGGMQCGGCSNSVTLKAGKEESLTSTLTAPDVPAGQTRTFRVQILLNNRASGAAEEIQVTGPDKPQNVRQVSGRIKDDKGKRISGAQVIMQDSAAHRYETTSNGDGGFAFSSSDNKPIALGTITVGAGKDGYDPATVNVQGGANKTVTVNLTLPIKAGASPSATPSATEEASAPADDEATDEATDDASTPPLNADKTAGDDGNGSLLFIILGGLLVAAGVGAIVLVLMRRRNSGGGDDSDPDGVPGGPGPGPAGRGGAYGNDATRVAAPVGARGADATMVAGAGGMADAPTVLQRAVPPEDEFPDPYGVPAQQTGYAGTGGAQPYGSPTQTYGAAAAPAQGGGYDEQYYDDGQAAGGGGYYGGQPQPAPQQRYDEPTGMYQPADYADDYQQAPPGAGGAAYGPGGAPQQQYGSWDDGAQAGGNYGAAPGNGYDAGYDNGYDPRGAGANYDAGYDNGYDPRGAAAGGAPAGGGTYGGAGGGGYQQPQQPQQAYDGGYDNGYDSGGGYDQRGGYDQGGAQGGGQGGYYGADQGQGGRRGGPPRQGPPAPEEPARPGQRRLPWMDD